MDCKDKVIDLMDEVEITEDNKVIFTDRAKEIIAELSKEFKESSFYKKSKSQTPEWVKEATKEEIYIQLLERIVSAPTVVHSIASAEILIPIIQDKIEKEEKANGSS